MTHLRLSGVWLLLGACSSHAERPRAPSVPAPVAVATLDAGAVAHAAPVVDWSPPKPIDLVATLPKVDFVTPYAPSPGATAHQQAEVLVAAGRALHVKQDWAGAEAKYVAALAIDAGHPLARYYLASIYHRTKRTERGLALLAELERADQHATVVRATWDDDWATEFGDDRFRQVTDPLGLGHDVEWQLDVDVPPDFTCPPGAKKLGPWTAQVRERYCAKGTVKHGPYATLTKGWHAAEIDTMESGEYRNGKKHGPWVAKTGMYSGWHGAFIDDERHGLWREYEKESSKQLAYDRGTPVGLVRTLDEDGVIVAEERGDVARTWTKGESDYFLSSITHSKDGKRVRSIEYDAPGRISADGLYEDDKQTGPWKRYSEGKLRRETTYVAGRPHGKELVYGDDDKPMVIAHWDHGKRHGVFEYWHAGKLLATTTMEHDSGEWIEYRVDQLVAKGRLVNNVREGMWELLDGDLIVGPFVAGKRVGRTTIYRADRATKIAEGDYKADQRHGAWTLWGTTDSGQQIVGKGTFAGIKREGAWQILVDGRLAQTLGFKNDKLVTVDGKPASKRYLTGFEIVEVLGSFPQVIQQADVP